MTNKHTPGPWTVATDNQTIVAPSDWIAICQKRSDNSAANARLIAAAPDMYAFIKDIAHYDDYCTCDQVSWHGPGHASECLQSQAKAIIAKVERP